VGDGIADAMEVDIGAGIAGIDGIDGIAEATGDGGADVDGIVCAVATPVAAAAIAQPPKTIPVNQRFTSMSS